MTRYRRRGHWRTSKNGTRHWVSGHTVNRYRSSWAGARFTPSRRPSSPGHLGRQTRSALPAVKWRRLPDEPNATCPVCGARVWFFRNEHGGCAYFDALGRPWPLHPCMARTLGPANQRAVLEAQDAYERALRRSAKADASERRRQQREKALAEKKVRRQQEKASRRAARSVSRGAGMGAGNSLVPEGSSRKRVASQPLDESRVPTRMDPTAPRRRHLRPGERPQLADMARVSREQTPTVPETPGWRALIIVLLLAVATLVVAWALGGNP